MLSLMSHPSRLSWTPMIHSADPQSRPVVIIVFAHVVRSYVRPYKTNFKLLCNVLLITQRANKSQMFLLTWLTHEAKPQSRPVVITIFTLWVWTSFRPSSLFKISHSNNFLSENNVRYWRDCGSGRVDHWWHLSCIYYFTYCINKLERLSKILYISREFSDPPSPSLSVFGADGRVRMCENQWQPNDHWWFGPNGS